MTSSAIRTRGLTKHYERVEAVTDLALDVPAGTIYGFLGPNGAGKTTTIRMLLGLTAPTSGTIDVLGFDPSKQGDEMRAHCGALLDEPGIYGQLTVAENLEFFARAAGMKESDRQARARTLLEGMQLWDRRRAVASTLSRGLIQRLALARAIIHRPQLLLLDEPTTGLDVIAARDIRTRLAKLAAGYGVTVFLSTHNMAEAEELCSCVGILQSGRLVAEGPPAALRAATRHRVEISGVGFTDEMTRRLRERPGVAAVERSPYRLVVDLTGPVDAAPFVTFLVESGARVSEVQRGAASLEEAFVDVVTEETL